MFSQQRAVFFHCLSPVHMGSGSALGVIDNPIQRERHTHYPVFAGSGMKGALRHHLQAQGKPPDELDAIFGPESGRGKEELYAGAISFTDAQLLLFPVRSLREGYVYVTSPHALARARRLLAQAGRDPGWAVAEPGEGKALTAGPARTLALELYEYEGVEHASAKQVAASLAEFFPQGAEWAFFRDKAACDLAIIPEEDFVYFVRNATLVEPHVAISDETGAADGGKLFYTENLPPEAVMVGLLLASKTRVRKAAKDLEAEAVLQRVLDEWAINEALLQMGGDATVGRGQVVVRALAAGVGK